MKSSSRPLRAAIVGSGPSGFFCADYLLRLAQPCTAAMFEQWPAPFGMVRGAVAPDHMNIRGAIRAFEKIAAREEFTYYGGIHVGRDLDIEDLRRFFDLVIVASGAPEPRRLNIEGETLPGCLDASSLAGWYNGRLDCVHLRPDLSCESAVIIGAGNAALDMARMLALPPEALRDTDISSAALDMLFASALRHLHIVARRGPFETRFSASEVELLARLPGCSVQMHGAPTPLASLDAPEEERMARAWAALPSVPPETSAKRCIHLHFNLHPRAILGPERASGVLFENQASPSANSVAPPECIHIPCGLVVVSIGHVGVPLAGLPFDETRRVIPNRAGRVMDGDQPLPGLYVAGWIKRGANGVIGTNKPDCRETVHSILEDRDALLKGAPIDAASFNAFLAGQGLLWIGFDEWRVIDDAERKRGQALGKARDPFLSVQAMLAALQSPSD